MTLDVYSQHVLSPKDGELAPRASALEACRWWPPLRVPGETDRFRLPNLFEWHPGDIVLFSGFVRGKDVVGRLIEKAQRLRFGQSVAHARWVHASVYIGSGLCVESIRQGGVQVKLHGLGERLSESLVRVRRLRESGSGKAWTARLGRDIAHQALSYIGESYAQKRKIAQLLTGPESSGRFQISGRRAEDPPLPKQGVFCSEMCRHALNAAAYVDFVYHAYQLNKPSPGLLSQSPLLEDVPVRWHEAPEHLETAYV